MAVSDWRGYCVSTLRYHHERTAPSLYIYIYDSGLYRSYYMFIASRDPNRLHSLQ